MNLIVQYDDLDRLKNSNIPYDKGILDEANNVTQKGRREGADDFAGINPDSESESESDFDYDFDFDSVFDSVSESESESEM